MTTDNLTFEQNMADKFSELHQLMVKKQKDYGPKNILNAPIDPRLALIVRINDKLARAANLIAKGLEPENENLTDTWMDIANYGVIGWAVQDGTFELPLGELDDNA